MGGGNSKSLSAQSDIKNTLNFLLSKVNAEKSFVKAPKRLTLLYGGRSVNDGATRGPFTFSEPINNFDAIIIYWSDDSRGNISTNILPTWLFEEEKRFAKDNTRRYNLIYGLELALEAGDESVYTAWNSQHENCWVYAVYGVIW